MEEGAGKRCSECDQYPNFPEGADRVGGQLRGDKECPFSGVTKSGRVWRKKPESNARSVSWGFSEETMCRFDLGYISCFLDRIVNSGCSNGYCRAPVVFVTRSIVAFVSRVNKQRKVKLKYSDKRNVFSFFRRKRE